ncbi:MAG: WD40 repeat domain-containing protein [Planctomycetes bacterium]|nr:WD40 repeat domain-containing protein [Planctomycetota bacterium]
MTAGRTRDGLRQVVIAAVSVVGASPALVGQTIGPLGTVGSATACVDVAMPPGGAVAVVRCGAESQGIKFLDAATGLPSGTFATSTAPDPSFSRRSVASSDNYAIVTGGAETASIRIFSLSGAVPQLAGTFGSSTAGLDVAMSPDGRRAVVRCGAEPAGVKVFDMAHRRLIGSFGTSTGSPVARRHVAMSDARAVTIGGADMASILVIDIGSGTAVIRGTHGSSTACSDVAISPSGAVACVRAGAQTDGIRFFSTSTGALLAGFATSTASSAARQIAMTDTRAVVVGGAEAASIRIFDIGSTPPVQLAVFGSGTAPRDVAVSPDGRVACVRAGASSTGIWFFDLATARSMGSFGTTTAGGAVRQIAMTSTRAVVLGGAENATVRVFDISTSLPRELATYASATGGLDVDASADARFAIVRTGQAITFVALASGGLAGSYPTATASGAPVRQVAMPGSTAFAIGGAESASIRSFRALSPRPVAISYYGTGCDRSTIFRPRIGVFATTETLAFSLQNAVPIGSVYFQNCALIAGIGRASVPIPPTGCLALIRLDVPILVYVGSGLNGVIVPPLPIPVDPALAGAIVDFQWAIPGDGNDVFTSDAAELRIY